MGEMLVKLLPWGNSYGLRVRKADAERLGLKPGETFACVVPDFTRRKDLSHWPRLDLGPDASARHDEGFDEL